MSFPKVPDASKSSINNAAKTVASSAPNSKEYQESIHLVNEWRVCHAYPINTFMATLRTKTDRYKGAIVAQRLKRLPTIIDKLHREPTMDLTRMQDIGGVRAIFPNLKDVQSLRKEYEESGRFTHELHKVYDYIKYPKSDGYRGVHLVYRYNNTLARNGIASDYKGLFVEVQLRTSLQHVWATAVETVGVISGEALKSKKGDKDWLAFFESISSVFALAEDMPVLDQHKEMTPKEIIDDAATRIQKLQAIDKLTAWSNVVRLIHEKSIASYYNLITLDVKKKTVKIHTYSRNQLKDASQKYAELESEAANEGAPEPVLVATGRMNDLKKAYPNYFLDISNFLKRIKDIANVTE